MSTRTEILVQNPHEFEPAALIAAITRAQRMLTGDLPTTWESTKVTIHTNGRDRDGMLECMLVQFATLTEVLGQFPTVCDKLVIAVGMIQRPGSTEFEFHS